MFIRTAASFQQGARTLPREYYVSGDVFAAEQDAIFGRLWNCVGRASRIAQPGDYMVRPDCRRIDHRRPRAGRRHPRLLQRLPSSRYAPLRRRAGRFGDDIRCPYHAWTYGIDGHLVGAPHMQDVEGFDQADYPLHSAACRRVGRIPVRERRRGSRHPFREWFAPMPSRIDRFDLAGLQTGHSRDPTTCAPTGSWCSRTIRNACTVRSFIPSSRAGLPYQSSANDLVDGPFLGGYMDIGAANESVTTSGRSCGPPISARMSDEDRQPRVLLLGDAEPAAQHSSGLRDVLPADAARRRPHPRRSRVAVQLQCGGPVRHQSQTRRCRSGIVVNRQDGTIVEQSQSGSRHDATSRVRIRRARACLLPGTASICGSCARLPRTSLQFVSHEL